MNNKWLTIKQLDKQLKLWQSVSHQYSTPQAGWIKTLREALCMTAEQLASRLGLSRARIVQLENAETNDAVTIKSMRDAANAMDCEFVYAIVPRGELSLKSMIEARAEKIARERIAMVAHTMALEKQGLDKETLLEQKDELTKQLLRHLNKKLWMDHDNKTVDELITHLKKE